MPGFNDVVENAKLQVYSTEAMALPLLAATNPLIKVQRNLAPGQDPSDLQSNASYSIHIAERNVAQDHTVTRAGGVAEEFAILDAFKSPNWVYKDFGTGKLRGIGLKLGWNEKYESDNLGTMQADELASQVRVSAIERHESLTKLAIDSAAIGNKLPAPTAGATPIRDAIVQDSLRIQFVSDNVKHGTSKSEMIVLMHPVLTKFVEKEIGDSFNNELPIYNTGLKSKFGISGMPVVEVSDLNKYTGQTVDERIGYIVMDVQALAYKKDNVSLPVNKQLVTKKYVGELFYTVQTVALANRIYRRDFTAVDYADVPVMEKVSDTPANFLPGFNRAYSDPFGTSTNQNGGGSI